MTGSIDQEFYYTIEKNAVAEFRERGSRFIAFAFPLESKDDFKTRLVTVKSEHPKATHYCFAYRMGLDGNQFRSGDDGEPQGTAGKPILGQIDSRGLTNVLIIVVRYFGGSLLGVPGLINAYKTAASLVLQTITVVKKQVEIIYQLEFDYTIMNDVMLVIKQFHCSMISRDIQLFCRMNIGIPVKQVDFVIARLNDLPQVQVKKPGSFPAS